MAMRLAAVLFMLPLIRTDPVGVGVGVGVGLDFELDFHKGDSGFHSAQPDTSRDSISIDKASDATQPNPSTRDADGGIDQLYIRSSDKPSYADPLSSPYRPTSLDRPSSPATAEHGYTPQSCEPGVMCTDVNREKPSFLVGDADMASLATNDARDEADEGNNAECDDEEDDDGPTLENLDGDVAYEEGDEDDCDEHDTESTEPADPCVDNTDTFTPGSVPPSDPVEVETRAFLVDDLPDLAFSLEEGHSMPTFDFGPTPTTKRTPRRNSPQHEHKHDNHGSPTHAHYANGISSGCDINEKRCSRGGTCLPKDVKCCKGGESY